MRNQPTDRANGFTLIEVLVAISVMALMALMAWRGLDGMLRTQSSLQSRSDEIRTLQAGLAQWQSDHDQLVDIPGTPSWTWDGKVLRLTRKSADAPPPSNASKPVPPSLRVVAWTWRSDPGRFGGGDWQRWQSGPLTQLQDWQKAWDLALQWSQTPDDATRAGQVQIHPMAGWKLFVHRGGSWANPLSSDVVISATNNPAADNTTTNGSTPDGIRLVLTLPPGPLGTGTLSLDWIQPTLSGSPS